jgi:hypothetical protein
MRKFIRPLLQLIGFIVIAAGFVIGVLSGVFVTAMLIAYAHDRRLMAGEPQMLVKATILLVASSAVVWLTGWLHKRFGKSEDESFRIVPSRSGRPERLSGAVFEILFFVVLASRLWAVIPAGQLRITVIIGWLFAGFAGLHTHILLHELGHLSIAWALGFNLRGIQGGTGPLLYAATWRKGVRFVWRTWPLGGLALATDPRRKHLRLRQSLFVAGGPLMDSAILFAGYILITKTYGSFGSAFTRNAGSFVAAAVLVHVGAAALGGLIPHTVWIGGRRLHTDGWLLLRTWLAPKGVIGFSGDSSWMNALQLLPAAAANKPSLMSAVAEVQMPQASFGALQARLRSGFRPQQ